MEKVGLKIVGLLCEIAQADYQVTFGNRFDGPGELTLFLRAPHWIDSSNDDHSHLGHPGCERLRLEKQIIEQLAKWRDKVAPNG